MKLCTAHSGTIQLNGLQIEHQQLISVEFRNMSLRQAKASGSKPIYMSDVNLLLYHSDMKHIVIMLMFQDLLILIKLF